MTNYHVLLCLLACQLAAAEEGEHHHSLRREKETTPQHQEEQRPLPQTKIVGGTQAALGSYPNYVEWSHGCSGVCKCKQGG